MPIVDDLNVGCLEAHHPDIRRSAIVEAPGFAVMHDRVADRPLAMLDEAAVTPAPGDAKSSGNGAGFPGRVTAARQSVIAVKDLSARAFGDIPGKPAPDRGHHCTPANR